MPQILVRVAGKRAFKLLELHKKYGDIVRTGPDQISFIHPNAWKQIYSFDHGKYTFKKHFRQYASFEDSHNILDAPGPAQHPRVRRALLPAFTDRSIKTLEPYFHKNVDRLVQYLSGTQQADMKNAYTFTTTDIVTDIASLDRPYLLDTLDSSQVMFATSLEYWIVQVITVLRHFPTAHYFFVRFILTPLILHLQRGKLAQDSYEKLDNDREDLWSLAQKNEDGNVRLSLEEIKGNGEILTIAGAETTSTALTALTWHALKTPETVKKLANEIRAAFTSPDDITFESIRDLPYLNACIKEALRIWPPVGGSMLRITPPQGGTICGEYLPGGVEISIPQYASGHLPAYWQDPEAFIPERWIDPKNTRFASDRREASNPFALGPQSCIGER